MYSPSRKSKRKSVLLLYCSPSDLSNKRDSQCPHHSPRTNIFSLKNPLFGGCHSSRKSRRPPANHRSAPGWTDLHDKSWCMPGSQRFPGPRSEGRRPFSLFLSQDTLSFERSLNTSHPNLIRKRRGIAAGDFIFTGFPLMLSVFSVMCFIPFLSIIRTEYLPGKPGLHPLLWNEKPLPFHPFTGKGQQKRKGCFDSLRRRANRHIHCLIQERGQVVYLFS